jgi:hypothetical protein
MVPGPTGAAGAAGAALAGTGAAAGVGAAFAVLRFSAIALTYLKQDMISDKKIRTPKTMIRPAAMFKRPSDMFSEMSANIKAIFTTLSFL